MAEESLDDDLQRFIAEHINSVEKLEILLLLSEQAEVCWTIEEVFKIIQSNPASIANRLEELRRAGLVTLDAAGRYGYKPGPNVNECVEKLRWAYRRSRVKLLEALFSDSMDQARSFAASFRLKKKN